MDTNLSLSEFAQKAGISISYASEILSGRRRPSAALARQIEERCGIPRHQLRPDIFDPPTDPAPLSGGTAGEFAPLPTETPQGADVSAATCLAGAEAEPSAPAAFSGEGAGGAVLVGPGSRAERI